MVIEGGQIIKVEKDKNGIITKTILTKDWHDWIDYWAIDFNYEDKKEIIVLLTNHLAFGATTISAIYKDRWQIEIFFKTLKQNLKIKTFVGTSKNALLIAVLLLKYLKFKSQFNWSLSNLVAKLRYNLFTYRDLWEWLNKPFEVAAIVPQGEQLMLEFK